MIKKQMKNKSVAVCYCLMITKKSSLGMTSLINWCQEKFETAGYRDVYQGFVMGRNNHFSVPFKNYKMGFRCEVDESEMGTTYVENFILSYGLLAGFIEKNRNIIQKEMDYFLVFIASDESIELPEVCEGIKVEFDKMKNDYGLKVCTVTVNDTGCFRMDNEFVDIHKKDDLVRLISQS